MRLFNKLIRTLLSTFLFVALSAANGQTNASPPSAQAPTVRATANLVLVDVVVTDRDRPVHGLVRSRFHVFEDGKERSITSFDEHQPGAEATTLFSRATLPPHTYTNVPEYPQSSAVNVLLLDGLNTPAESQMLVRRKMLDYLGTVRPGTPLAIFTLSTRLRMVTSFTNDAAALVTLFKKSKTNPQQSAALAPQAETAQTATAIDDMRALQPQGPNGAAPSDHFTPGPIGAADAMQQFESDFTTFQIEYRMKVTLSAMQELARYLGGIEGRKNVIWFTGAFPFEILPDSSVSMPFTNVESFREQIEKTAGMLTASRVAIYPVDAGGLWVEPDSNAAVTGVPRNSTTWTQTREQQYGNEATMREVAEQTGGRAYVETNELDKAVTDAVENGASYYTIAYVPQMAEPGRKLRSIRVKLDDDRGIKLEYRRGYYTEAPQRGGSEPGAQLKSFAIAIAPDAPQATQILLKARVLPASDPAFHGVTLPQAPAQQIGFKGPAHRYIVDLTIDPHNLAFNTTPEGDHKGAIEFAMVAYDADGQRLNFFSHAAQVGLKAAQFQSIMKTGITVRLPIDLPGGPVDLRIGVHDLNADRAGTLDVPLVVEK